jgi:cell division protein ZapA (FtsZ GTPase activity inhibitor)
VVVKHTITLEIAGTKFRLVSDADEGHLQSLAAMINERVEKLGRGGARSAPSSQLLALAALDLADELVSAQNKLKDVERLTRSAVANAIARIDARLSAEQKAGAPE